MKTRTFYPLTYLQLITIVFVCGNLYAQSTRSHVNKGVDLYDNGKYIDSEVEFKKGLEKTPANFQAQFNLGDSYYKEGKYDDAVKSYSAAIPQAGSNDLKARAYHNVGNALLKAQKLKESVDAYSNALRLNPNDQDTKYNLSYALDLLKDQNKKDKNDKNNQNKDKQNKNDQNQNNKQNNQDKDQNKNDQQNQQDKNKQQNQQAQNQPQPNKISKDQAQAIFNALNNDEKDLQKQLRKMKGEPIKTDKDW